MPQRGGMEVVLDRGDELACQEEVGRGRSEVADEDEARWEHHHHHEDDLQAGLRGQHQAKVEVGPGGDGRQSSDEVWLSCRGGSGLGNERGATRRQEPPRGLNPPAPRDWRGRER